MAAITIRNLSDETLSALKLRAARGGRSTEAEIRAILDQVVRPQARLGSALAQIGGVDLALKRKRSSVKPANF